MIPSTAGTLSRLPKSLRAALLVASMCLAGEAATAQTISVRERWSNRGSAATLELGSISGMAEAADGSIWISDDMSRVVATLDATGRRVRIVAKPGSGPGEVGAPSLVAGLPSGEMGIYDLIRSTVEVFGADRRFRRRIRLPIPFKNPKGFVALPSGGFVVSGGSPTRAGPLHRFDRTGRLVGSWGPATDARDPLAVVMIAGGAVSTTPDGSLLFSRAAPHGIFLYPATGEAGRRIASVPSVVPPIGDAFVQVRNGERTFQWEFPQSAGVFRLRGGEILNVVWDAPGGRSTWEVYRADGRLVTRRRFPRAYRPWGMTRDGDVLASYTDPDTDEAVATRLEVAVR